MYEEVSISSNNVPITLSIWYTEKSSPTIVFLPGTMSHPLMYENFLCGLCERGFNIIGVHYLSHGKSPKIKMNYTMEDLLYNVYDATTYGIENYGDNIAVMGSSQGGILAAMAAGRDTRLKAVFPHNIMLTTLKETMSLTKYPAWSHRFMGLIQWSFRVGGKLLPNYKVPGDAYLDYDTPSIILFASVKACINPSEYRVQLSIASCNDSKSKSFASSTRNSSKVPSLTSL